MSEQNVQITQTQTYRKKNAFLYMSCVCVCVWPTIANGTMNSQKKSSLLFETITFK